MSRALAIATAILKIWHSYVSAQTPTCLPGSESVYDWTFNSLGESPCNMTISLAEVCYSSGFTMDQLAPNSTGYNAADGDPCECSTVFYSLLCACTYCQNSSYLDWSGYNAFCTKVYDQIFPAPIPIPVPHYAYLDVVTDNTFNVTAAMSAGGPETTPVPQTTIAASTNGATSTNPTSVTTSTTPTTSAASTPISVPAIVGGVVGGIAVIVTGVVAFLILSRKQLELRPSTNTAPRTMSGTDHP